MCAMFNIHGKTMIHNDREDPSRDRARRKREEAVHVQSHLRMLESNLAKALLINQALWELLRDKAGLTEDDLNNKLYEIDMRDGQLDGKNQRSQPIECPNCGRVVSPRHAACIYCGQIMSDSVFDMTK
ncbi:MAG: zinc ribbon domain-containing protein [Sedimentisphaerales bacterium]|nr:zinc ribbon domain-containing protein [Sedimentisphaerales bacterium]